jgi:hypothetical protein
MNLNYKGKIIGVNLSGREDNGVDCMAEEMSL